MDAVTGQADSGESERLILDMVDKFLSVEVQPHVHALEHDDVYPAEIVEKMKAMGLFDAPSQRNTEASGFRR